jgi:hypothetical protein
LGQWWLWLFGFGVGMAIMPLMLWGIEEWAALARGFK